MVGTATSAWAEFRAIAWPDDRKLRALVWATATTYLGTGLFYSVSALFFSRVIGLSAAEIGFGLAIAGAIGAASAPLAGLVTARCGARRTLAGAVALLGLATASYVFAVNYLGFVVLAALVAVFRYSTFTARASFVAVAFTGPERVRIRARIRVVTNASVSLGGLAGAAALGIGTAEAFVVTVLCVGVLIMLSALPLLDRHEQAPPQVTVEQRHDGNGSPAHGPFRDPRYLGILLMVAVNAVYFAMTEVGVPLWLTQHTRAPVVLISFLLALNTVVVALGQIPAARGTDDVRKAGRAALVAGVLLVGACAVLSISGWVGPLAASALLVAGVVLNSLGEVFGEASSWGLTMELAHPGRQPAYQAATQMAYAIGQTFGPLLIAVTALAHGPIGWLILAAMFAVAGTTLYALSLPGPRTWRKKVPAWTEAGPTSS